MIHQQPFIKNLIQYIFDNLILFKTTRLLFKSIQRYNNLYVIQHVFDRFCDNTIEYIY